METNEAADYSVYLVTDTRLAADRPLDLIVEAAIRGGAKIIQYRDKGATTRKMVETAKALCCLCHRMGARFLVNDRLDVALAVDADGIHIGQDDMPPGVARKLLGPDKLIGVTVHNLDELKAAEEESVEYLSIAPIFATSTKPDHQSPLGLKGLRALAMQTGRPLVAIGGISHANAAEVIRSGAHGVCVVSAIMTAADPENATRELYRIVKEAKDQQ
jgi:thiamine-phosphate pyrophosphorylase